MYLPTYGIIGNSEIQRHAGFLGGGGGPGGKDPTFSWGDAAFIVLVLWRAGKRLRYRAPDHKFPL